ncbi:hypothetical protein SAMN05518800_7041 [Variovorax sp. YR752]|nr:hypothetical protein SAMN05518800_7041 [Variovorax sp. YR752]
MSESSDPIANLAFAELLISCQVDGCPNVFKKSLEQPANDPVEEWSVAMALSARDEGWGVDSKGLVLCPMHAKALRASIPK